MRLDGQDVRLDDGTLELETQDMRAVQRVLDAMEKRENVALDATYYYPVSISVQIKEVVVPDISSSTFSHKHEFRPVATITLRAEP